MNGVKNESPVYHHLLPHPHHDLVALDAAQEEVIPPYTVESAAVLLHCSEYTVRELCRSGRLPGVKLGEDWIIPAGALFARLDEIALEESLTRRAPSKPQGILNAPGRPTRAVRASRPRPVLPVLQPA
jgi:excisionase family DNA binding protein